MCLCLPRLVHGRTLVNKQDWNRNNSPAKAKSHARTTVVTGGANNVSIAPSTALHTVLTAVSLLVRDCSACRFHRARALPPPNQRKQRIAQLLIVTDSIAQLTLTHGIVQTSHCKSNSNFGCTRKMVFRKTLGLFILHSLYWQNYIHKYQAYIYITSYYIMLRYIIFHLYFIKLQQNAYSNANVIIRRHGTTPSVIFWLPESVLLGL